MTLQQWVRLQEAARHIRISLNDIDDINSEISDPEIEGMLTGVFQSICDDVAVLENIGEI